MVCLFGFDAWTLLGNTTTGHKLRGVYIPDTVLFENHVLRAWYYTDKQTGVLQATPCSQLSTAALLHKLTAQHATYDLSNPKGWVAVAYFANYITRLVNKKELQELLSQVYVGAVPADSAEELAAVEQDGLQLLALQAFIIPTDDERYITTLGGVEGASTVTQVRRYSGRFTAGASGAAATEAAAGVLQQAMTAGATAAAGAIESQYDIHAANAAAAHVARPAVPAPGSRCGSVISLCSHPACSSESDGCLQHPAAATAASVSGGPSSSCGSSNELQDALPCKPPQQHQVQTEANISTGSAELQLQTPLLEQQDGFATPTMLPAQRASLRNSAADYADASESEETRCSSSQAGAGYSCSGGDDVAGASATGYHTSHSAVADSLVCGAPGGSQVGAGLTVLGNSSSDGMAPLHILQPNSSIQAAPGPVARAASATLQALVSYLDKAHGLRVQGLAAEFIKDLSQQLWLIGLHSITLDPQQSQGSSITFTKRWGEFLAGAGPPPAPALPQHSTYGCLAAGVCNAEAPAAAFCRSPTAVNTVRSRVLVPAVGSPTQQLNRQFFPLLSVDMSELPKCRPQSAEPLASRGGNRPMSAHRCLRPCSPQLVRPRTSPSRCRPATAAAGLSASVDSSMGGSLLDSNKIRGSTGSSTMGSAGGAVGTRYTSRNAASAARPGAGGNPTSRSSCCDSYTLWMQQPVKPADSVTAQLASQLEWAKEQVQQYADLAEAAELQASTATEQAAQQVSSVHQELLQLRHDAAAASRERRHLQQQVAELDAQRSSSAAAYSALQQQLMELQEQLAQDRGTIATMLRQHQQQKQQLDEEVSQLQQHNGELRCTAQQLASRLDEESEVVSALRAQLVDYKLQMEQVQLSAKKGRSLYTQNSTAGGTRRGGASSPPAGQLHGGVGNTHPGAISNSGFGIGSTNGMGLGTAMVSLAGANGPTMDGAGPSWSLSSSGNQRRLPGLGTQMLQAALSRVTTSAVPGKVSVGEAQMQLQDPISLGSNSQSGSGAVAGSSSKQVDQPLSCKAPLMPLCSSTSAAGSRGVSGECYAGMLGPTWSMQAGGWAASNNFPPTAGKGRVVGPGTLLLQQLQQTPRDLQLQPHDHIAPQQQQEQQTVISLTGSSSRTCSSSSGTIASSGATAATAGPEQHQLQKQQHKSKPTDPDTEIAAIAAEIAADIGEPLTAGKRVKPQLFIGDLLVTPAGALLPTAEQQLAVISGLFQEVAGDLLEVWSYYSLLGSQIQVVADRVTMDLKNLGKLAYDLHIAQDSKSLSAIEDVFYLLSDRRPCLALKAKSKAPSAEPLPGRPGHQAASRHHTAANHAMFGAAAAAAAGSAYLGPGTQHAVARAAASEHMGTDPEATSTAAAAAAAVMVSVLGPEVLVPEQFPEAITRLACVRYRWGVINSEYDWDDDDWSCDEDELGDNSIQEQHIMGEPRNMGSPRMNRLQQQKQEQDKKVKRGPKVLRPEGRDLYTSKPPAVALRANNSRSPSPHRSADYPTPSETDDLVTVVKRFLQHEVLKHARRNRLAGSTLGHRRAQSKPPNLVGWKQLPQGVISG